MFSRVAGLLIPCLAVLIAKTAGLAGAFAPDQRARTPNRLRRHIARWSSPTPGFGIAGRRPPGSTPSASPGSNNLGGEPWDNPVYLNDPAQFDKLPGLAVCRRSQHRSTHRIQ
ncbi:MAG: hypothetical protein ACOX1P_00530 [Thermoguttaceae bacterium]